MIKIFFTPLEILFSSLEDSVFLTGFIWVFSDKVLLAGFLLLSFLN